MVDISLIFSLEMKICCQDRSLKSLFDDLIFFLFCFERNMFLTQNK